MKYLRHVVFSVKEYDYDGTGQRKTLVRVDQYLHEDDACALMDSTVYELDDFRDVHEVYLAASATVPTFKYTYGVYTKYCEQLKKTIELMMG